MPRTRSQKFMSPENDSNLNITEISQNRSRRKSKRINKEKNDKSVAELNSVVVNQPVKLDENISLVKSLSNESPIAYVSLLSSDSSLNLTSSIKKSSKRKSRKSKPRLSTKALTPKLLNFDVENVNEPNEDLDDDFRKEIEEAEKRSRRLTRVFEPSVFEIEECEDKQRRSTFSPDTPRFKHQKDVHLNEKNSPLDAENVNLTYSAEKKDATFSPESPHFKYQNAFDITNSTKVAETSSRNSAKYKTSTPFKSGIHENSDIENTPKSIIKRSSRRSLEKTTNRLSQSNVETSTRKPHITLRKKRSISDTEIDASSQPKKSRVTFHPNTSVFRIDIIDSSSNLDSSGTPIQDENSIRRRKQTPYNRRMTKIISKTPLNDHHEFPTTSSNSAAPSANVKPATPQANGINKLNRTSTPAKGTTPARSSTTESTKNRSSVRARRILSEKNNSTPHPRKGVTRFNKDTSKVEIVKIPTSLTPAIKTLTLTKETEPHASETKSTSKGFSSKKVPDFSSIHKKNFAKMESIDDHVQRKAERAKNLFGRPIQPENKVKEDFKKLKVPNILNNSTFNRFGFNVKSIKNKKEQFKEQIQKKQTVTKDVVLIRNEKREYIKGVRSNRRFDLLMKSRMDKI